MSNSRSHGGGPAQARKPLPAGELLLNLARYDGWNRVNTASEGSDYRNFGYSPTGNMWVTTASGGWTPPSFTPRTSAWFDANNRLVNAGLGVQYDAAGNQTAIGGYAFTYDAEGRMTGSTIAGAATAYAYDGEGRRVKKTAAGVSTVYVYGADGELAAEYGGPAQTAGTRYLTTDHLGSTRLVTDASGNVVSRHDYLPFGEEIPAGVGGRTTAMGYVANPAVTQKFTGKERDSETGLDYFGARYLSGVQGRWTSPDAPFADQYEQEPLSWNLYSYVRNNPLTFIDPTGTCSKVSGGGYTDDGEELFAGPCANGMIGGSGPGDSATVTGTKGNAFGAFALNAFFALDATANAYFSQLVSGMGGRPTYMQDIPTNREFIGQAAAATVFVGTALIGPGSKAPVLGRKLDYLLGFAAGNAHNIARSRSMASALNRIGIHESAAMREYLAEHLTQVLNDSSNIVSRGAGTEVRESLLMGPGGAVKLETVWQGDKLITAVVKEGAR